MRVNERDWRVEDVVVLCRSFGIDCDPPRNGSHYKVRHASMVDILTVPAHRPIKPIYIRLLVRFVDEVRGNRS